MILRLKILRLKNEGKMKSFIVTASFAILSQVGFGGDGSSGGIGSAANMVALSQQDYATIVSIDEVGGVERINLKLAENIDQVIPPLKLDELDELDCDAVLTIPKDDYLSVIFDLDYGYETLIPNTNIAVSMFFGRIMTSDLKVQVTSE